jgi:TonB dependent receptor-like, beta-barrel/Carboxypeptidase regulatory-like domain/TonB-dependent Receptor Plug Domain
MRSLRLAAVLCVLLARPCAAQTLTGALFGTVTDEQGGVLPGARVELSSDSLIGGRESQLTNAKGQLRFPVLPPGRYVLDVAFAGFTSYHEEGIDIGVNGTIERSIRLSVAALKTSVVVDGAGSHIDARNPGLATHFDRDDLSAIPTRRGGMADFIRMAPGVSPTSPSSGTATTISAFGSGTNENQFLIDGTSTTCPCNGVARSEPVIDFIQEIQIQSVGASAEYGNVQGAIINVITRQGSERYLFDAAFFVQHDWLTAQPVQLPYDAYGHRSGYERVKYGDVTTSFGGPAVHQRLWFFAGYQHTRDYDTQPGADPAFSRTYQQDKASAKLMWKLATRWQLMQSVQYEYWVNPEPPTSTKPFEATQRRHASVPAVTFGHLTHVLSDRTVLEARAGWYLHSRVDDPSSGSWTTPSRSDRLTGAIKGNPMQIGRLMLTRATGKASLTHYRPGLWGADHQWKVGGQIERGESQGYNLIPTGVRFVEEGGRPYQSVSSDPSVNGGLLITAAAFASDDVTVKGRLTISAGVRYDHSRAISQDVPARDLDGNTTGAVVAGLGTLYTWNIVSPRVGFTMNLSGDGRTMLRGSYGRFSQGVVTGEFSAFHPGVNPVTTSAYNPATGLYTRVKVVDSKTSLQLDPGIRAPHTDEYSVGVDREIAGDLTVAIAGVHKRGASFIGWTEVGGQYVEEVRPLPDGRPLPVWVLTSSTADLRYRLTNPDDYSLRYDGLTTAVEKRRSHGWQAFGSYTWSKVVGLQASSGMAVAGAQSSTVALPTVPIGRDPNDLTNAWGRLLNDRPHVLRVMGSVDVPRTGFMVAANLQQFSGKPWAATTQMLLPQGDQRILLEPRGTRRLSSQTLLDLRISRTFRIGRTGRIDLLFDLLNALNDTAEEELATDNLFSPNFGQPTVFMDPRRAMIGVRLNLPQK